MSVYQGAWGSSWLWVTNVTTDLRSEIRVDVYQEKVKAWNNVSVVFSIGEVACLWLWRWTCTVLSKEKEEIWFGGLLETECSCLSKSICWSLLPNVMVFGSEAFRRYESWEWDPHELVSAFIKETPESPLTPFSMWGPSGKMWSVNQEEGPPDLLVTWSWTCRLQKCEK